MSVTTTPGGTMITGDDIAVFRIRAIASGLALEVNCPGMRATGKANVRALANQVSGSKARTKKAALADLAAWMVDHGMPLLPSVQRALSK